jgi:hypothetical protein
VPVLADIAAEKGDKKGTAHQGERCPCETHQVCYQRPIFASGWVVVKAEQQNLVDGIADLVPGGLDEAKADVARRVFNAVEVT